MTEIFGTPSPRVVRSDRAEEGVPDAGGAVEEGVPPEPDDGEWPQLQVEEASRHTLGVCRVARRQKSGLALRAGPDEGADEIGRLQPGERCLVLRIGPDGRRPWTSGNRWSASLKCEAPLLVSVLPVVEARVTVTTWRTG